MLNKRIFILVIMLTFFVTLIITDRLIKFFERKKISQKILEIGPCWHKSKEGTPTMGGVGFVIASFISFLTVCVCFGKELEKRDLLCLINVFMFGLLNCLIGVIDDLAKVRNKRNEGLTPKAKLIFQGVAAILFLIAMKHLVGMKTALFIPFLKAEIELGFAYYILTFLLLCGTVNAVNITDGLDGLASICVLPIGALFIFFGINLEEGVAPTFFGAMLIGITVSFLIFNLHPARIFMGDTGSLFLGAIVVGVSFAIDNPALVLIYGMVFIFEAVSDILQVGYFKVTKGKRLFKMAPFHHHLERCGLSEMKIVYLFGAVSTLFCVLACFGMR